MEGIKGGAGITPAPKLYAAYAPSVQGGERELYFLTDTGTANVGHRIEDQARNVLYEAKMTKHSLMTAYGFDLYNLNRKKA